MKRTYQIFYALFWMAVGGFIALQLVVQLVISPGAQAETPEGRAIYNLFDYIFPYTMAFVIIGIVLLLSIIILKPKTS